MASRDPWSKIPGLRAELLGFATVGRGGDSSAFAFEGTLERAAQFPLRLGRRGLKSRCVLRIERIVRHLVLFHVVVRVLRLDVAFVLSDGFHALRLLAGSDISLLIAPGK